jgi:HSP20 family protein
MNLVRFNHRPFAMPSVFDEFLNEKQQDKCVRPATNILDKENEIEIMLALPGIKKSEIKIDVEKDILSISSQEKEETEVKEENYARKEFAFNSFCRSFMIPDSVNADKIKAKYEDGILSLIMPKKEEQKSITKKISIS